MRRFRPNRPSTQSRGRVGLRSQLLRWVFQGARFVSNIAVRLGITLTHLTLTGLRAVPMAPGSGQVDAVRCRLLTIQLGIPPFAAGGLG